MYLIHYTPQGIGNKKHYDLQFYAKTTTEATAHRP